MVTSSGEGKQRVLTVDPKLAKQWLDTSNKRNRHISEKIYKRYAKDMSEGRWHFTGDPISFDSEGVLINGQHRLMAIVESGTTQRFSVWENLLPEAQDAMDQGAIRKPGQQLQINGYAHGAQLASIARVLIRWDRGMLASNTAISTQEVLKYVKENITFLELAVEWSTRISKNVPIGRAPVGAVAFRLFEMAEEYPDLTSKDFVIDFLERLHTGVGLETDDPILVLRNSCLRYETRKVSRTDIRNVYNMVRTWNGCVLGEKYGKLQAPNNGVITPRHLVLKHEVEE